MSGPERLIYKDHQAFGGKNTPEWHNVIDTSFEEYVKVLGTFEGLNLKQSIERLIAEKGEINWLDLGCGKGNGLQLPLKFQNNVHRYGITAAEFRNTLEKTYHKLNATHIIQGDAHHLSDYFSQNKFDIVTSYFALEYMENQTQVLQELLKIMAPGGIAFLHRGCYEIGKGIEGIDKIENGSVGISFNKKSGTSENKF
jgi:ubiquinone/menaquinone biosynthesis C-methylase UbiE